MPSTNFRDYRWLIDSLIDAGEQGLSLNQLNQQYQLDWQSENQERKKNGLPGLKQTLKRKFNPIKHNTFSNWRAQIYKLFGIIVDTPKYDNYYVITNPHLWDSPSSLKDLVQILVDEELRGYNPKPPTNIRRGRRAKVQTQTFGIVTGFLNKDDFFKYGTPQFGYDEIDIPEMVDIIRFTMVIGEALVIHYSKTRNGSPKSSRKTSYVFEPQEIKQINGRWYVGGNIYPYGHRNLATKTTYDVEQIRLSDIEDVMSPPRYEITEEFDMYSILPTDWKEQFDPNKVVSMETRVAWNIFEKQPFCQAQEKIVGGKEGLSDKYKIYVLPNEDFLLQYFSYGDEVSVFMPRNKVSETGLEISKEQVAWLQQTKNKIMPFNEKELIVKSFSENDKEEEKKL